jgi:hypothetical protein
VGPWSLGRAGYSIVAALAAMAMVFIFVIGVQPPNQLASVVTVGFLILTAIVWLACERRRFQGPPVGGLIAARQAEIAKAEAALKAAATMPP